MLNLSVQRKDKSLSLNRESLLFTRVSIRRSKTRIKLSPLRFLWIDHLQRNLRSSTPSFVRSFSNNRHHTLQIHTTMLGVDMTIRFLNPSETAHVLDAINNDPEFKLASRFFSKDILLVVGDSKCIIKMREGVVIEIKRDPTFMNPWSFFSKGSTE